MIEALRTLNRLKKAGLVRDYAIAGGYAVNYYLEPILTYDLDIFLLMNTDEEFSSLYRYFKKERYKIENPSRLINLFFGGMITLTFRL